MSIVAKKTAGRSVWLIGVPALIVVVAIVAALLVHRGGGGGQLAGGTFTDTPQAPDFQLADQNGQMVHMAALRGKVVALTFLYTNCPDVCPVIASNLGVADRELGATARQLQIVAVSVDPVGDTPINVRRFLQDHSLSELDNWHYVMGSRSQLQPVWSSYHVAGSASDQTKSQDIEHSALVYLVDRTGKLRVILPSNFTVQDFVRDVRALAAS